MPNNTHTRWWSGWYCTWTQTWNFWPVTHDTAAARAANGRLVMLSDKRPEMPS